ncbi:S2-RNase [Pyrus ussuriensis x Pyrus communis]|uniref:S2-RNase n=1 Tax=Pyrus ussuriensis x Pyrus communis TaxID=2448454 RepID=A0A5N5GK10_9ROSA|nr:S2-RNase [Pyrus ussuriensis x Pyrus communis]
MMEMGVKDMALSVDELEKHVNAGNGNEGHGKGFFGAEMGAVLHAKGCVMNDEVLHVLND